MKKIILGVSIALAAVIVIAGIFVYRQYRFYTKDDPAKWEDEVTEIESWTGGSPLRGKAVVFIGSSSIKQWESLRKDLAPLPVLNHGFGGSRIQDSTWYVPRLVTAYRPSMVVLYAGDNDIFFRDLLGKKPDTARRCLEDFKAFVTAIHKGRPEARVFFVSIKPSPSRMKYWPQMREANRLIRDYCAGDGRTAYIDVASAMLSGDGTPIQGYFLKDGLHLTGEGYRLWASIIKPVLEKVYRGR